MIDDTIAAISTPFGEGGISIIRISGPEAFSLTDRIFQGDVRPSESPSHRVLHGRIRDPENSDVLDDVLLILMRAPSTYTAENVVEINCHGGILVTRRILQTVLNCGARLAEPGEFTKRAFLNGRIDLAQAEAVLDIIRSRTPTGLTKGLEQLAGNLSKKIEDLRGLLIEILAQLEVAVDFSDSDIQPIQRDQLQASLKETLRSVEMLIETSDTGRLVREGAKLAIVGQPNVGKSSLLNALLMEDRAIVSSVPGTTRDTIEEWLNIDGFPLKIIDTAGLGSSEGEVEKEGERRAVDRLEGADLVLFMVDGSMPLDHKDEHIARSLNGKTYVVVVNKSDLPQQIDIKEVKKSIGGTVLNISALKKRGLGDLKRSILERITEGRNPLVEGVVVTHLRHREVLAKTRKALLRALETTGEGLSEELIAVDVRDALVTLGEITGETTTEEILDTIFSEFCIGK